MGVLCMSCKWVSGPIWPGFLVNSRRTPVLAQLQTPRPLDHGGDDGKVDPLGLLEGCKDRPHADLAAKLCTERRNWLEEGPFRLGPTDWLEGCWLRCVFHVEHGDCEYLQYEF